MNRIKSFEIDHTKLEKGMYISRMDGDIVTYDLRMVKPNTPPYLENAGLHTFEHLLATFMRNSELGKNVVYVGPMGCRTGFYLLMRDVSHEAALILVKKSLNYIMNFNDKLPGGSEKECGNYKEHDVSKAQNYAQDMNETLKSWNVGCLNYRA